MGKPVVIDLETKRTFRQTPDPKKLGISVVGLYDYASDSYLSFLEKDLTKLYPYLENASVVIGYNIISFDLPVLQAYYPGNVESFRALDILNDIKEVLGRRLALNDVVGATLHKKKSGHGLEAIELYKKGEIDKLTSYCLDDVRLTKELYDFGLEKGEILYPGHIGHGTIKVDWVKFMKTTKKNDISLTLPF